MSEPDCQSTPELLGEDECPNSPDGAHDFEDHGGDVIKCKVCGEPEDVARA